MKTELTKLISLSLVDEELATLTEQKELIPQKIGEIEKKLAELLSSVEGRKKDLQSWKLEQKQKELDLSGCKELIQKREVQLKEIKTNKEYHAVLKEINQGKKTSQTLEEEILKLISRIEEETSKVAEAEKSLADEKQKMEKEIEQNREEAKKIEGLISEIFLKRKEAEKELDEKILRHYETIKNRLTPAMAKAHQGTCLECNTKIPPQLYIELQKLDRISNCPRCHRILYLDT